MGSIPPICRYFFQLAVQHSRDCNVSTPLIQSASSLHTPHLYSFRPPFALVFYQFTSFFSFLLSGTVFYIMYNCHVIIQKSWSVRYSLIQLVGQRCTWHSLHKNVFFLCTCGRLYVYLHTTQSHCLCYLLPLCDWAERGIFSK